ncbi:MAG: lpxB [Alphaproteobacteria bacterium]|nr:lpxB [Alphaproteobacteria bacterium]
MKALKGELGENVAFVGVGGPLMAREGLSSLFPIEELSIMGLAEVLPHIWRVRRRIQETVTAIEMLRPDVVVTVDAPGFNFRVGKALKKRLQSIPLVHYVAPSVWAWRPNRAHAVAQFLDHLLVLFPFEPPYFLKEGLATDFVGHPVVELGLDKAKDPSFRARHNIPAEAPVLTLLPGSRRGEISRLLSVFQETVGCLQQKYPDLHVIIPTLPHLKAQILDQLTLSATLVTTTAEKFAAYQESRAALAASGTVSLELAAAGLPMVIAYKLNPITHFLVQRLVKVKYACLINLLLNKEVVAERLQKDCTPAQLAIALEGFLQKEGDRGVETRRDRLVKDLRKAVKMLEAPRQQETPSQCAARLICHQMGISKG